MKTKPEIWGGIECTINRVHNKFYDQLRKQGHYERENDLEAIADLGIKKLRYPILWESCAPDSILSCDFSGSVKAIKHIEKLGMTPIAGLLHHGSGPEYTNLLDPDFPMLFSKYAYETAKQFPEMEFYTPVNEPLTTARFSALYGLWYPHKKDNYSFCKALLNQIKAIVMAMRSIRLVNSEAKLVQTEDIGKTQSTAPLKYQADFDNCRRWVTYDLLCGRVIKGHPMYDFFLYAGIKESELSFFEENICPPDIIGVNYYVTSERFLDHNFHNYPSDLHGGNDFDKYADVETVRTDIPLCGIRNILKEVCERYNIPIAITEVHLGCSEDERLRWFTEIWDAACELNNDNGSVTAVTAWALLGSYDWNTLLTSSDNIYEPGVFDISSGNIRNTILAEAIRSASEGKEFYHPVLASKGWWHRPIRIQYKISEDTAITYVKPSDQNDGVNENVSPLLIIGATGSLGKAFARVCNNRAIKYVLTSRKELDICRPEMIENVLKKYKPWAVINTAGFVRVDEAELNPSLCFNQDTFGATNLAKLCANHEIKLMTFSSDMVFDGIKGSPYTESDRVSPLNIYGKSKARAEEEIFAINKTAIVVRTSSFFSPWDNYNFIHQLTKSVESKNEFYAPDNIFMSPSYVPELVNTCLDILIDNETGIWHLTNNGIISWFEFAKMAARTLQLSEEFIKPVSSDKLNYAAVRPKFSALRSEKSNMLGELENALENYKAELSNN